MNKITINGVIHNIEESHETNGIDFKKADIICMNSNGKESILNIKFKKFSNTVYKEGDTVTITGNLRSFSKKVNENTNKVSIYVYTYFDEPEELLESGNSVDIDGRICSIEPIHEIAGGKKNIHFILANNIFTSRKINSYIPCIAWGKLAIALAELPIGTQLKITNAELRSREYVKHLSNGEDEFRMCHELYIKEFEVIPEEE